MWTTQQGAPSFFFSDGDSFFYTLVVVDVVVVVWLIAHLEGWKESRKNPTRWQEEDESRFIPEKGNYVVYKRDERITMKDSQGNGG